MNTLPPETKRNLEKLNDILAVYLFGSRAQGKSHAQSDYDYAVLTKSNGNQKGGDLYFSLYDILSAISPRTFQNDVVDIVFLKDVGLELCFHVIQYGKVILDRGTDERLNFEALIILRYCDYRPILVEMDRAILETL